MQRVNITLHTVAQPTHNIIHIIGTNVHLRINYELRLIISIRFSDIITNYYTYQTYTRASWLGPRAMFTHREPKMILLVVMMSLLRKWTKKTMKYLQKNLT